MKRILSLTLILSSLLLLAGWIIFKIRRERDLVRNEYDRHRQLMIAGLSGRWEKTLHSKVIQGEFSNGYYLKLKKIPRIEFNYPFTKSVAYTIHWDPYVDFEKIYDTEEVKDYLISDKWERIMEFADWLQLNQNDLDVVLQKDEQLKAKKKVYRLYSKIFGRVKLSKTVQVPPSAFSFDKVYYKLTARGEILAFIPSAELIKDFFYNDFLLDYNGPPIKLSSNPWKLKFVNKKRTSTNVSSWVDMTTFGILFFMLGLGIWFYLSSLRDKERDLVKKVNFLNQVVHEIKTPLTGLKLHSQLLNRTMKSYSDKEQESEELKDMATSIEESANRLDRLFNDILLINRPGQFRELKQVNESELNSVLDELEEQYGGDVKVLDRFESSAFADPRALKIILKNLTSNAIRYGKVAKIKVQKDPRYACVFVEDEGPGIKESEKSKIFSEFYRSEWAKNKTVDGMGLGLSIIKKLCKNSNMKIDLMNPGKEHAIFRVSIPRTQS